MLLSGNILCSRLDLHKFYAVFHRELIPDVNQHKIITTPADLPQVKPLWRIPAVPPLVLIHRFTQAFTLPIKLVLPFTLASTY